MQFKQQGQTLIETMVAMFVLVMGIGAAFGLTTSALSSTTGITNQVVGMGLAREGIEVVKNMRDTNWLNTDLSVGVSDNSGGVIGGCYDFQNPIQSSGLCYENWLGTTSGNRGRIVYPIDPTTSKYYILSYLSSNNSSLDKNFALKEVSAESSDEYKVYQLITSLQQSTGTARTLYTQASSKTSALADTIFNRRISLSRESQGAFSYSTGPALKVAVDVWWSGKNCPVAESPSNVPQSCKITLETYLTNWKTY